MVAQQECKTCTSTKQDAIEADGLLALRGEISWREAGRRHEMAHSILKNHMEKHYQQKRDAAVAESAQAEFDRYVESTIRELYEQMDVAHPDVKPLILAEIHNLRGLKDTKPSQQHLIMAKKGRMEIGGGTPAQRMMLTFLSAMGVSSGERPALPAASDLEVIDVESEEVVG